MAVDQRIEALKQRHHQKDIELHEEVVRPAPDSDRVHQLKLEKLHLKDELARLESDRHQRAA